jgi:Tfp pilus assembly protein PilX
MDKLGNERGVAILFTLFVIIVLSVLGAAFVVRSITESRVAQKYELSTRAFWLADAGINKAAWELKNNNCAGFLRCGTATACTSCSNCGAGSKCIAATLGSNGDYDVTLDSSNTLMTSTGSYPSRSASNKVTRRVQTAVAGNSLFSYAAFAQNSVSLSNNSTTDSYNSNLGNYGVGNKGTNGSVGTNGSTAGTIALSNNAKINGNASTGASGTVTLGSNASVSGTTTHASNVTLSVINAPAAVSAVTTNPDNSLASSTKSVGNNGSATLTAGNWKYSAVSLSNNATLTISGDVNLYLTGGSSLSTGNNVVINVSAGSSLILYADGVVSLGNNSTLNNVSRTPSKFVLYSAYTGANGVSMSNNGALYGAIFAPRTDVAISNNGDTYGSVVGKTISVSNNGNVHYDEALTSIQGSGGYTTSNWQEP